MPALAVILAFVKGGLGWLWEFFSSHIGQLVLVGLVCWFWSAHRTNVKWEARVEADRQAAVAAAKAEETRQADAAREIAEAATDRLAEEQALVRDLQAQIEAFDKEETIADEKPIPSGKPSCTPAVVRPCRVDDAFFRRLQQLDAAAHRRAPGPAHRAR